MPKKSGMTVVENKEWELISKRAVDGQRVCIDYRKLNAATLKDHFLFPFIDHILERITGHAYYYFLDGYSKYNRIFIFPEN